MKVSKALAATTALALVAGWSAAHALPLNGPVHGLTTAPAGVSANRPLIRVQSSVADAQAALAAAQAQLAEAQANGGDVATAQAAVAQAEAALAAAQATENAPPAAEVIPQEQPAPAPEEAPAEPEPQPAEPAPEAPAPEAPAEVPAPPVEAPAEAPVEVPAEPQANEPLAPQGEAPAEPSPLPEAPPEIPAEDAAPAPDAPAADAPAAEPAPQILDGTAVPAPDAPAEQPAPPAAEQPAPPAEAPAAETPAAPAPAEPAPAAPEVKTGEPLPSETPAAETPAETPAAPAQEAPAADAPAAAPAAPADGATITPEATLQVKDGAPILDSAKEAPSAAPAGSEQPATQQAQPIAPAAPPPTSDAEAQAVIEAPAAPAPQALSERGERFDGRENRGDRRRPPENAEVIQEIDNRVIFEINNRIVIEGSDSDRIRGGSENVYYERLPRGRTLEVIERRNGTQIVTIRDRWGDVEQRSKVLPDGREILLTYAPRDGREERRDYYDAGRDLPPLRLTIPVDDYILDATRANPEIYYDFLEEPPVERVERIYSVDEVRHSARIRDKVRRIDLDSLTFEFGKATIAEDQVAKLSGVAEAITRILEANPAETFLIEGHTDAVGTDRANLILSDSRAETVAVALSDVFGIAPENLVAQGYGERYLKVTTEEPERLNRRVTIRRITPLVTPVASR